VSGLTKIKLVFAYDGSDFYGFAKQANLRTVQGTLESVLERVVGYPIEVFGSGRTDKGVHARAQVVHWEQTYGPPAEKWVYVLRRSLPPDIIPLHAESVDASFHARFSAVRKTYRYTIQRAPQEDIFTYRYAWHLPGPLNLDAMQSAAQALVGEHDFTSFCAASTPVEDKRRTIYEIRFEERDSYLDIYCTGNGFLQNMVRIITGTLVDVGSGRIPAGKISEILSARDRRFAGQTAPARGLSLWQVDY
jgi:tRNA pseudouridine38-40 synthase